MAVAMGFTVVSDYFLVLANNHITGVFTFCFVHIVYILRVSENRQKSKAYIAATVCGGGLLLAVLPQPRLLIILAMVYAALFIQNLFAHIIYCRSRNGDALPMINRRIMLAGLILFALCDIHVLMFNLHYFLPVPPEIGLWGRAWIWVFYMPSQLLLGVSSVRWSK